MPLVVRADQRPAEGVDQRRLALVFQGSLTHPQPILVAVFLVAAVTLVEVMLPEVTLAVSTMVLACPGTIHPDRTAGMADPMDLRMM
jgi:hypothetical protein